MRFQPNPRLVLALGCLIVAVVLPPAVLVDRFLPGEYASHSTQVYQGLWVLKIALGFNVALWLAWPKAARILDGSQRPVANSELKDDHIGLGRGEWALLGTLTVLATILRCWGLDSSFTFDEITFAKSMVLKSPLHIFLLGAMNMSQFSNWLAWATTHVLGFSEVSMRLPAVAFGAATVPVTYLFARRWLGRGVAVGAAVLLTLSTQAIFYSQEAKGYTATSFFAVGATWSFLEARRRGWRRDWLIYGVCGFFLGFAHVVSLVVIIAHLAISLFLPDRRRMVPALIVTLTYVAGALGLIYSASAPQSVELSRVQSEMHYGTVAFLDKLVRNFGVQFAAGFWSYGLALFALVGAVRLGRINRVLLATFVIPVFLGLLFKVYVLKYMYMRYFNFALPFYMILASLGVWAVAEPLGSLVPYVGWRPRIAPLAEWAVPLALLALWIWPCAQSLRRYHARDRYPFKDIARRLAKLPAGSTVVAGGFGAEMYQFYSPSTQAIRDFKSFYDFVKTKEPNYVITFHQSVFQNEVTARGYDPLVDYRPFYHAACHDEEDGHAEDGLIWRRSSEGPGAQPAGSLADGVRWR